MIDNTTDRMKDPAEADLFLAVSLSPGGSDEFIAQQERAGQAQLVHSDRLPTDIRPGRADFEALGFTFGEPDPSDPMFAPATLPEGWTRQASDHAMWSYIVDKASRQRVGIFYKAAFYDRSAHMSLQTVWTYVHDRVYGDHEIVTDDTWATPHAVLTELRNGIRQAEERIADWTRIRDDRPDNEWQETAARYITQYTAERDKWRTRWQTATEAPTR